jgi:hypothetical protein
MRGHVKIYIRFCLVVGLLVAAVVAAQPSQAGDSPLRFGSQAAARPLACIALVACSQAPLRR